MNSLATRKRVRMISRYAETLTAREQERLLNRLREKALLDKAKKLKGKVKPNSITMDDILEEIALVRKTSNG
ncbi:MAG: hypothetical protein LH473_08485 [Chitinophagales bacterium]|nr:hypothetical protein [Chitinophagales bacterium]